MPVVKETDDFGDVLPTFKFEGPVTLGDIRKVLADIPAEYDSRPFCVGYLNDETAVVIRTYFKVSVTELVDGEVLLRVDPSVISPPVYWL